MHLNKMLHVRRHTAGTYTNLYKRTEACPSKVPSQVHFGELTIKFLPDFLKLYKGGVFSALYIHVAQLVAKSP